MVVVPFLRAQGLNNIDMMVVSHGDNDHIGGVASVLSVMPTKRLLSSVPEQLPIERAEACYSGQAWQWDGVDFEVLQPFYQQTLSENDNSCVLKVSTATGSVLLTGDIEKPAENILIDRQSKKLQSTILVVPHHGSKTSSATAFIDAVSPDVALIPVGYRNRFKLPRQDVVDRYLSRNIEVLATGRLGALQIRLGRDEISTTSGFRSENRRYWTHLP